MTAVSRASRLQVYALSLPSNTAPQGFALALIGNLWSRRLRGRGGNRLVVANPCGVAKTYGRYLDATGLPRS